MKVNADRMMGIAEEKKEEVEVELYGGKFGGEREK